MGHGNAFNTIRLLAAIAVLFSHAYELTGLPEPLETLTGQATIGQLSVAAFFVISGFLISASFDRSTFASFVGKRARRILPGLSVAVALTVFVLGPIASSFDPGEYFQHRGTWTYLGQAAFLPLNQTLPGVFTNSPSTAVNGSLWSLRFEVACYLALCVLMYIRPLRLPLLLVIWLTSFYFAGPFTARPPAGTTGAEYYLVLFASLFRFFGAGMLFYNLAQWIPINSAAMMTGFAICVCAAFTPYFNNFLSIAGAYSLLSFSYLAPSWFANITERGDVSYGVYIYAYPIQQLFVGPSYAIAFSAGFSPAAVNTALALPVTAIAGVLSWRLIEKPMIHFGRRRAGKSIDLPSVSRSDASGTATP